LIGWSIYIEEMKELRSLGEEKIINIVDEIHKAWWLCILSGHGLRNRGW